MRGILFSVMVVMIAFLVIAPASSFAFGSSGADDLDTKLAQLEEEYHERIDRLKTDYESGDVIRQDYRKKLVEEKEEYEKKKEELLEQA